MLLSFSPIGKEDSISADEHVDFTSCVLSLYGKSWKNGVALVGDNCATSKAFVRKANCRFVGCASYGFNLAVQDVLSGYDDVLALVNNLMSKLRNLLLAAKLRKLTPLKPKLRNVTTWRSAYEMLQRYQDFRQFIPLLQIDEIDELTPTSRQNHDI